MPNNILIGMICLQIFVFIAGVTLFIIKAIRKNKNITDNEVVLPDRFIRKARKRRKEILAEIHNSRSGTGSLLSNLIDLDKEVSKHYKYSSGGFYSQIIGVGDILNIAMRKMGFGKKHLYGVVLECGYRSITVLIIPTREIRTIEIDMPLVDSIKVVKQGTKSEHECGVIDIDSNSSFFGIPRIQE